MEDLTSHISTLSLIFKILFILFATFEILLPRFNRVDLKKKWNSTYDWEIRNWMVEGGAFVFSLGFLMIIDIWANEDSWVPLFISILLDLFMIVLILFFLFSPKVYGVADHGIYANGWMLTWENITEVERKGRAIHVSTKGHLHETKKIPLHESAEERGAIMELIEAAMRTEGVDTGETGNDVRT